MGETYFCVNMNVESSMSDGHTHTMVRNSVSMDISSLHKHHFLFNFEVLSYIHIIYN